MKKTTKKSTIKIIFRQVFECHRNPKKFISIKELNIYTNKKEFLPLKWNKQFVGKLNMILHPLMREKGLSNIMLPCYQYWTLENPYSKLWTVWAGQECIHCLPLRDEGGLVVRSLVTSVQIVSRPVVIFVSNSSDVFSFHVLWFK